MIFVQISRNDKYTMQYQAKVRIHYSYISETDTMIFFINLTEKSLVKVSGCSSNVSGCLSNKQKVLLVNLINEIYQQDNKSLKITI